MSLADRLSILIVDDEPDRLSDQVALELTGDVTGKVVHPNRISMSDLNGADLVLVDYRLDRWTERDAVSSISLRPATGLALAVLLREQVDQLTKNRLVGFALHTGHLSAIQGRLLPAAAHHVLARLNNLEWVFSKADSRRYEQMGLLAGAVRRLPQDWPSEADHATSTVRGLVDLDETESSERCWHDVLACRVPLHELAGGAHGLVFVRWLIHQILPYPTFLWPPHWVAARLRITAESLSEILDGNSRLSQELKSMRYSGILAGFLGERWWRGRVEDYAWSLALGGGGGAENLQAELSERADVQLHLVNDDPTVVCLDQDFQPTGAYGSPRTAVALRPDHWPNFADPAWIDIETVRDDPSLRSYLDPFDLYRIDRDG